jgi:putative DNA primase/helicase
MDHINDTNLPLLSASDVLKRLGIHTPSNSQSKEVNKALRELLGDSKRIQGVNKWRVPLRQFTNATSAYTGSNDDYLY